MKPSPEVTAGGWPAGIGPKDLLSHWCSPLTTHTLEGKFPQKLLQEGRPLPREEGLTSP